MQIPLFFIAALLLGTATQPACAGRGDAGGGRGAAGQDRGQQQGISAAKAAEVARAQTGGRVLAVKQAPDGFQVKVLTPNGEVRNVFVPAAGR